ncbi:MAG: hypothetical protein IT290_09075 [Deltaproteobacteria bacterium]|nr:hypothetical protein [Deltaproteobacteria bacterium]
MIYHTLAMFCMLSKFVSSLLQRPAPRGQRNYKLCSECRTWFYLTPIEVSYYASVDSPQPGVCRSCKSAAIAHQSAMVEESRQVANY